MTQLLEGWNGVAAQAENISNVLLVGHTPDADVRLCESLVHSAFKDASHGWSTAVVAGMGAVEKQQLVLTALRHLEFYDAVPREFEHINFTFELRVSASCFAQLKRHRMMTQTPQPYDTALTPTVPLSIEEMGLADEYLEHCRNAVELYAQMEADHGEACAEYVLTNGHKRRVLATLNLREFYHFARMRQDAHAQWDIRNIANRMMTTALAVAPIGMSLVCGKDNFVKQVSWAYDEEWAKTKQAP
jgi:thymidylate synthase ThyX